jgi:hypothetical protein
LNLYGHPGYANMQRELEAMIRARPGIVLDKFDEPVGMA